MNYAPETVVARGEPLTEEHDGTLRRYGLTVPAEIGDAAAAWTFRLSAEEYRMLESAS